MAFGLEAVDDHLQAYFPDAEQFILQEQKTEGAWAHRRACGDADRDGGPTLCW